MTIKMASESRMREFMQLFTTAEPHLRAFALAVVPHWADAEDVLQEANLIIWQKFDQFQTGTDFPAWARRIVKLVAMDHRKRQARSKVRFGDEFFDAVEQGAQDQSEQFEVRQRLLADCIARLRPEHREILMMRYEAGGSPESIAAKVGRTTEAIYRVLSRVRIALSECIERKQRLGEAT